MNIFYEMAHDRDGVFDEIRDGEVGSFPNADGFENEGQTYVSPIAVNRTKGQYNVQVVWVIHQTDYFQVNFGWKTLESLC